MVRRYKKKIEEEEEEEGQQYISTITYLYNEFAFRFSN